MTDIRLDHLSLSYGDLVVLDDFSLTLPAQSVTGIAGRSGCGKTTLLKAAALQLRAQGLRVAACFQDDRLLPHYNVARNIELVAPPLRIHDALAAVELSGTESLYPHELSGGMRQRVALARALAYESDVLLLDEPFKSLDAALGPLVMERLFSIVRAEGRAVLFISHDAHELAQVCDRIHIVHGPPLAIAHSYDKGALPADIAGLL